MGSLKRAILIDELAEFMAEDLDWDEAVRIFKEIKIAEYKKLTDTALVAEADNNLPDFYREDYINE